MVTCFFAHWVNVTEPAPVALRVRPYYRGMLTALPLVVLAALMIMDLWVYRDASARAEQGRPVVFSLARAASGLRDPFQLVNSMHAAIVVAHRDCSCRLQAAARG